MHAWCCALSMQHVLTKEEGNENLLKECVEWLQERTPRS